MLKIPASHRKLVKDYNFEAETDNTLKNDKEHIGVIDEKNKKIKVAAPWNYGREFTILHEVAHAVFKYMVDAKMRKEWTEMVKKEKKKNKDGLDQNDEELFCMMYAQHYAKNKLTKFDHPDLEVFISKLPK